MYRESRRETGRGFSSSLSVSPFAHKLSFHRVFIHPQVLVALACDLGIDLLPCCVDRHEWGWFRRYCMASRIASSLDTRLALPSDFVQDVREKIKELIPEGEGSADYLDHNLIKREQDEQLLLWLSQ